MENNVRAETSIHWIASITCVRSLVKFIDLCFREEAGYYKECRFLKLVAIMPYSKAFQRGFVFELTLIQNVSTSIRWCIVLNTA